MSETKQEGDFKIKAPKKTEHSDFGYLTKKILKILNFTKIA